MITFDKYLRAVLDGATGEAARDGSATVEAHHLLLAMAAEPEPGVRPLLASVGLDPAAVRAALDREFEHSLSSVGVALSAFDLPAAPPGRPSRSPGLGASVRLALERGVGSAVHQRDLRPGHQLLGVLLAPVGTVPRALEFAGVDRTGLIERLRSELEQS